MKLKALAKQNMKKELKETLNWTSSTKLSGSGLSEHQGSDKHFQEAGLSEPTGLKIGV